MITQSSQAIGELYEIAARRRFEDDWGDRGQLASLPRPGIGAVLARIGQWLESAAAEVRFVGAYGVAR